MYDERCLVCDKFVIFFYIIGDLVDYDFSFSYFNDNSWGIWWISFFFSELKVGVWFGVISIYNFIVISWKI